MSRNTLSPTVLQHVMLNLIVLFGSLAMSLSNHEFQKNLWTHSDGAHTWRYTLPLPTPTHPYHYLPAPTPTPTYPPPYPYPLPTPTLPLPLPTPTHPYHYLPLPTLPLPLPPTHPYPYPTYPYPPLPPTLPPTYLPLPLPTPTHPYHYLPTTHPYPLPTPTPTYHHPPLPLTYPHPPLPLPTPTPTHPYLHPPLPAPTPTHPYPYLPLPTPTHPYLHPTLPTPYPHPPTPTPTHPYPPLPLGNWQVWPRAGPSTLLWIFEGKIFLRVKFFLGDHPQTRADSVLFLGNWPVCQPDTARGPSSREHPCKKKFIVFKAVLQAYRLVPGHTTGRWRGSARNGEKLCITAQLDFNWTWCEPHQGPRPRRQHMSTMSWSDGVLN